MIGGRHVAPHRLVDAQAGHLSVRESARIERHVGSCGRCAAAHERLVRARAAMADIAAQPAPELGWDHIGVRVYWSTSSARHAALRDKQRAWWRRPPVLAVTGAVSFAAAAGFALTLRSSSGDRASPDPGASGPAGGSPVATDATRSPPAASATRAPIVPPLRGMVTFVSGAVAVDGAVPRPSVGDAALFAAGIIEGAHLRTGEGRLVVQFGQASGFALTPRSSVRLQRFDERTVELAVEEGAVEVEVSRRRTDQSLVVVAGRHRVSVRGTLFQVAHRTGALDVECARGQVVVSDGHSEVSLAAGEQLQVLQQSLLARALRRAIGQDRLAAMERKLARPLLPAWTESQALFETSSMVEVTAPPGRAVRVDGVEAGIGSFSLRVMSGRHHLQVADASGGFERGAWIDAEPRARQEARVGSDGVVRVLHGGVAGASSPSEKSELSLPDATASRARAGRRVRQRQLQRAFAGSVRARHCMTSLEKRDLVSGSYVTFDVGVNADGSQGHLNVVQGNVPPDVERCLRAAVDDLELPVGPQATVRLELAF